MINSNIPNLDSMGNVKARVDFYNGSTLAQTCYCRDYLEDFELTREGDNSKFFGFGVCHRFNFNLVDLDRNLDVAKDYTVELGLGDGTIWDAPYPTFYITELKRDEKTNTITATSYDRLYWASEYLFKDLGLSTPYTIWEVISKIAAKLGITLNIPAELETDFLREYPEGANLEGVEDLRSILNWIAEVTQTVYFVNWQNKLTFKRLDRDGDEVFHITRDLYYELDTKTPRTLVTICHTGELGDNVETTLDGETGAIQYIRNNPFLETRSDLPALLDYARDLVGGTTITQFDCDWSGNYLLEIGDKLALTTEDGGIVYAYLLSDAIVFAGTLNEKTEWDYTDQQPETYANPTNIGERINQTFAKVDRVNKQITLHTSAIEETRELVGELSVSTQEISASISVVEQQVIEVDEHIEGVSGQVNSRIDTLSSDVALKLDRTGVEITVDHKLQQGVDKVVTAAKKYTFDDTGLNIESDDSEISTRILEDGMRIYKNDEEVLTASNKGVTATDLYATTFLIIGDNSRLENSGNRTACFWIGPSEE